jgi:hypothetical protein
MTKTYSKFIALFVLAAALCFGQGTRLTMTTNSTAITQGADRVTLASSTGVSAQGSQNQFNTVIYIDRELMGIKALVSGTTWTVERGLNATRPQPHAASSTVFVGAPAGNFSTTPLISEVSGSCTYTQYPTLPIIYTQSGNIVDCVGGKWVRGLRSPYTPWKILAPDPGGVAYTALNTNGTTLGATTLYCTEVNLPTSKLLTGIAILNGTTVGTDAHYVALYDNAGRAIANSALAGATAASASAFQEFAFTTPYYAVGPAQYFACMQTNGTTATVRMAITGTNDTVLTKGQTGATYGTLPTLTVPTSFTTAVGPYSYVY